MLLKVHIRTVLDHIRRSPFQALSAVSVLYLTFLIGTIIAVLFYSSGKLVEHFETRPQVIAFLKDGIPNEKIAELQNKLQLDTRLKDVRYVSKEEALLIYKEATLDNPLLAQLVSPGIFPASLEFSLKDLSYAQSIINEINEQEIIEEVGFTASIGNKKNMQAVVERLREVSNYVRLAGLVFVSMLGITSCLVLTIIISMRMATRKGEVEILDLIGAKASFINIPIILEAIFYSLSGVFLGWLTCLVLILYSTPSIILYFGKIKILPRNTLDLLLLFGVILTIEIVIGILLALFGSAIAISRARKSK